MKYMHTPPLYIYSQPPAQINPDTQGTHINTKSLLQLPFLAEQDKDLLVGIYILMYNVDSSSSWAQTVSLPSSCLWTPVSPAAVTWTYKLSRPHLPYSSGRYRHACIHTHMQMGVPVHPQTPWSLQQLDWTPGSSSCQLVPQSHLQ